jgi:hypothetical protein
MTAQAPEVLIADPGSVELPRLKLYRIIVGQIDDPKSWASYKFASASALPRQKTFSALWRGCVSTYRLKADGTLVLERREYPAAKDAPSDRPQETLQGDFWLDLRPHFFGDKIMVPFVAGRIQADPNLWRRLTGRPGSPVPQIPSFDVMPDLPHSFGYKTSWFVVKAPDPAAVLNALEFGEASQANWASGLAAANEWPLARDPWAFVSPPIGGWILVVGYRLPYPATIDMQKSFGKKFDVLFSRLMSRFEDVQFFGSDRRVGFVAWTRAVHGKPVRVFSYADGEVFANFGEQTPEEAQLRFANLTGLPPPDARDRIFQILKEQDREMDALRATGLSRQEARARLLQSSGEAIQNESDVLALAALWSFDPTRLPELAHSRALGLAARIPKTLTQ